MAQALVLRERERAGEGGGRECVCLIGNNTPTGTDTGRSVQVVADVVLL